MYIYTLKWIIITHRHAYEWKILNMKMWYVDNRRDLLFWIQKKKKQNGLLWIYYVLVMWTKDEKWKTRNIKISIARRVHEFHATPGAHYVMPWLLLLLFIIIIVGLSISKRTSSSHWNCSCAWFYLDFHAVHAYLCVVDI